jgi:hypothetical protein
LGGVLLDTICGGLLSLIETDEVGSQLDDIAVMQHLPGGDSLAIDGNSDF